GAFTGLSAGNYDVAVRDNNGCIQYGSTLTLTEPAAITITGTSSTDITCNGANDGTITVTASGGTGVLQYTLNPVGTINTTGNFTNLAANTYTVEVTDANNCGPVTTTNITINEPPAISITGTSSSDITCNGANDGTITVTASGGTGALQYTLNPGGTTNGTGNFTNLAANTYTVDVTDANGCGPVSTGNITINEPTVISIDSETKTDVTCNGGNDGTITIAASGGSPPYRYSVDGGVTFVINGGVFTGLTAGIYNVAVADNNGCTQTGSTLTVSEPTAVSIDAESKTDVACNGGNDGAITISVSGGTPPYRFSIDGGITFVNNGGLFTGLVAGSYDIAVRDNSGCIQNGSTLTIIEPAAISIDSETKTDISCNGLTDGTITITTSGGTPPYEYSVDGGTTYTGNGGLFTGLASGNYDIAVRDTNGCTQNGSTLTITEPPVLLVDSVSHDNVLCFGDNTGTISIYASGGTGAIEYSVNGGISFAQNGGAFTGLIANNYNTRVRDINGCFTDGPVVTITEPSAISATIDTIKASCSRNTFDGEIILTATGGTSPFSYSIDGGTTFTDSGHFVNLEGGIYSIVVSDSNQCRWTGSTELEGKLVVIAEAGADTAVCPGESIQLNGSGGTTFLWAPVSWLDDPNIRQPVATPDSTLWYYVTVSSGFCFDKDSVHVTVYPVYGLDAGKDTTIFTGSEITLQATGSGFTAYTWTPPDGLSSTTGATVQASPDKNILYYVIAETPEGCFETDSVFISLIQEVMIPSGFTPNGDGVNDTWHISSAEYYPEMIVEVFDRWGQRIFYSKGYGGTKEWDGTYNGKQVASGTYYFVIRLYDPKNTAPFTGPVTIIR
ncbi:MAG: T9SS type B sorting domain-containing protein, partial [Chlorobi bacterium]|nr:T9SS type B sorting domain-containing protein [Chlorobiota bacterium]